MKRVAALLFAMPAAAAASEFVKGGVKFSRNDNWSQTIESIRTVYEKLDPVGFSQSFLANPFYAGNKMDAVHRSWSAVSSRKFGTIFENEWLDLKGLKLPQAVQDVLERRADLAALPDGTHRLVPLPGKAFLAPLDPVPPPGKAFLIDGNGMVFESHAADSMQSFFSDPYILATVLLLGAVFIVAMVWALKTYRHHSRKEALPRSQLQTRVPVMITLMNRDPAYREIEEAWRRGGTGVKAVIEKRLRQGFATPVLTLIFAGASLVLWIVFPDLQGWLHGTLSAHNITNTLQHLLLMLPAGMAGFFAQQKEPRILMRQTVDKIRDSLKDVDPVTLFTFQQCFDRTTKRNEPVALFIEERLGWAGLSGYQSPAFRLAFATALVERILFSKSIPGDRRNLGLVLAMEPSLFPEMARFWKEEENLSALPRFLRLIDESYAGLIPVQHASVIAIRSALTEESFLEVRKHFAALPPAITPEPPAEDWIEAFGSEQIARLVEYGGPVSQALTTLILSFQSDDSAEVKRRFGRNFVDELGKWISSLGASKQDHPLVKRLNKETIPTLLRLFESFVQAPLNFEIQDTILRRLLAMAAMRDRLKHHLDPAASPRSLQLQA